MIRLPEILGRDLLAQITGGTPRIMLRLSRYLDRITSRPVTIQDAYIWVIEYSNEVYNELCNFVDHKLAIGRDKDSFKRFLKWYMEPSSEENRVPPGPF